MTWLAATAVAIACQGELEALVERHVASPDDAKIREELLAHGRPAVPLILKAAADGRLKAVDRAFLNRLKFEKEDRASSVNTLKKARETKIDLIVDDTLLLQITHAITTRSAAMDR
ncbi:MAG TPA: hypothetical protein VI643_05930 [Planctomycetota bacterium]|nr:hypothetical protein [Planctomycetota bacterium]